MRLIGFYSYTVILTYMSLVSGLIGMTLASRGRIGAAICCLLFSGVCDLFDGVVARSKKNRTTDEKNFGIQIDSLCDTVCFGVFPAVILYFWGVDTVYGIAVLILYVLCAVIRLGFFNVLETKRQMTEGGCAKSYRGLPVTSAAIIFPIAYLVSLKIPTNAMEIAYCALAFVTAVLFVADFRVPKIDIAKLFRKTEKEEQEFPLS